MAKKKSASKKKTAARKKSAAPKRTASKKVASKKKVAARKSPARKPAARKPVARKAAPKSAAPKSAARKPAPKPAVNAGRTAELDSRIAIARDNLRQLVEQAASVTGASGEELLSQRIAEHESRLEKLKKEREAL